jgi:hypothetical protein
MKMTEYVKHTGGSHAGKSKKPYDAMVYKDADSGYTIAVDGNGNVIKKVLSSANTDDVVIQGALDSLSSYSKLQIIDDLSISATITISEPILITSNYKTLTFSNTSISIVSNDVTISKCKFTGTPPIGSHLIDCGYYENITIESNIFENIGNETNNYAGIISN